MKILAGLSPEQKEKLKEDLLEEIRVKARTRNGRISSPDLKEVIEKVVGGL